jgi:predicted transcriptional regulator
MELDLSPASLHVYEALGSQTRLKILEFIGGNKRSVSEIATYLNMSNSITTRHIQQLEDCGILDSERGRGKDRNKKLVYLKVDHIYVTFPAKIYHEYHQYSTSLKLGHFTNFSVTPTCGLATATNIVGQIDEPKYFMDAQRVDADLLWFKTGFVEYTIPNFLNANETPKLLEICFEIASEFPVSNNLWPSDISIYINDIKVAIYTAPGNFSDVRGRYTPQWWNDHLSQYGLLKHVRINEFDTTIDGVSYSDITLKDLNLSHCSFIRLKFAVEEYSENRSGLTLFGKSFGNYNQDILINLYYVK